MRPTTRHLHAALAALALTACREPRFYAPDPAPAGVTLGAIHHADADLAPGTPWRVAHPDGALELDRFILVTSDVELHACVDAPPETSWLDALVPSAHAHVPDSATRLGTPFVEDLLAPAGKARVIGEIGPPLGLYCALVAIVAPADDDVLNPTEVATEALEGKSLLVSGRWRAEGATEWTPFAHEAPLKGAFTIPLDPPLELTGADRSAFLLVDKRRAATTLSQIPADALTDPARAPGLILDALASTFAIYPPRAKNTP
jgi:hypothetical protein